MMVSKMFQVLKIRPPLPITEQRAASTAEILEAIAVTIPKRTNHELIRIGGQGDGAYLLPNDLRDIEACFSPGVCNRKDFEDELASQFLIKSHMCDFSSDHEKLKTPIINGMQTFEKKWLDIDTSPDSVSLDGWVAKHAPGTKDLLLQIDIEGAEYRNLLHITNETLRRFRIIVIELHYLSWLKEKQFLDFVFRPVIEKIGEFFDCVHAHPNNCCGMWSPKGSGIFIPNVIELTFLRKDRVSNEEYGPAMLPHPLDITNVFSKEPIHLGPPWTSELPAIETQLIMLKDQVRYLGLMQQDFLKVQQDLVYLYKQNAWLIGKTCSDISISGLLLDNSDEIAQGKKYRLSSSLSGGSLEGQVATKRPYFFHTGKGYKQFIEIDLQDAYDIHAIIIENRSDTAFERARDLFIRISMELGGNVVFEWPLPVDKAFISGEKLSLEFRMRPVRGKFLTIFNASGDHFHLSSIQVFGKC